MRRSTLALLFAALAFASFAPSRALADQPAPKDEGYFTLGLYGAMGTHFGTNPNGTNDYRFGGAAQLGYTLRFPIYLGAFVTSYAGQRVSDLRSYSTHFGADVGVDLKLFHDHLVLRPVLGIGAELIKSKIKGMNPTSDTGFLLLPGLALHILVTDHFFLGAQARVSVAPHGGWNAGGFHFLAGLGFMF